MMVVSASGTFGDTLVGVFRLTGEYAIRECGVGACDIVTTSFVIVYL